MRARPGGRLPRASAAWSSGPRRDPRRAAAARHRRGPATAAGDRHRVAPARFGGWGGGLWLPECAYSPGLEASWPSTACAASAWTRPRRTGSGSPSNWSRSRSAPASWPCPSTGRRSSSCGTTATGIPPPHLSRLPPPHRARPAPVGELGRALRPRGRARARARARPRVRAPRRSGRRTGGARPAGWSAARWTPSCSGTGGTRARTGCASVLERGRRQGLELATVSERLERTSRRASASSRASTWGAAQGPLDLGRPGVAELALAAPDAPSCDRGAAAGGARPTRRSSAPRASCSRSSRATGPSWSRATWRPTTRAARRPGTRAGLRRRARRSDRLRARAGAAHCATSPRTSTSPRCSRRESDARPHPVLGVPAPDRGRPGAPRAQAGREPRARRASRSTCSRAAARSRPPRRRWRA